MSLFKGVSIFVCVSFVMLGTYGTVFAATAVDLGTAGGFAVLAGSTVTNTGNTVVNGDLGLSPGTSVTGFPPGTVNGAQHITDAVATQAEADLVTAYNAASGQSSGTVTVSGDLGGQTLIPGLYNSASSLGLTGTLSLDAQGNPDAVFLIQIGSALTTASASNVNLLNGAQACNVFWQIGSSATLGTNSHFVGTIIALSSVTVNTGASIEGRVLARNGAVTLDTNPISKPACAAPAVVVTPTPPPAPVVVPVITSTPVTPPLTVVPPTINPAVITAIAPVPVPVAAPSAASPSLPNTGFGPGEKSSPLDIIFLPLEVFLLVSASVLVMLRKRSL